MPTFTGGLGDDIFNGGADNDTLIGNGGNDRLSGGVGDDILAGGTGADVVNGDDGSDTIYTFDVSPPFTRPYYGNPWTPPLLDTGSEVDTVNGGVGSDRIFAGYGDNVDGGADFDSLVISFRGASAGISIDFGQLVSGGTVTVGGGILQSIETIEWVEGSNFDDMIVMGNDSNNFAPVFGLGGNDHIIGGYYTGDIHGGDGDDIIDRGSSPYGFQHFGEAGNDLLIGSYNGELLDGGDGNDELRGFGGFDTLIGGAGDDLIDGGSYGDDIRGGSGNDTIYGGGDADTIDGGSGDDVIYGDYSPLGTGNATSSGNDDRIFGGTGADTIYGDDENDQIWSGERDGEYGISGRDDTGLEHDRLFGGLGNDTLAIGLGDDADGGGGVDSLRISLAGAISGVTFNTSGFSAGGLWSVNGGTIQNIETLSTIVGSAFGDTIIIGTHSFGISVNSGAGDDTIISSGSSVIADGGDGNDYFTSGAAGDIWDGGPGSDTISYQNSTAVGGATVVLAAVAGQTGSGAGGDQLINIENIVGSAYGDTLTGNGDANVIRGDWGNDTLSGLGGNDTIYGEDHNDTIYGGDGQDTVLGGTGDDVVYGENGDDQLNGNEGSDTLSGGIGNDVLSGDDGDDTIRGDDGNDTLNGGAGNDTLNGGADNDTLTGGDGIDTLNGGTGNDIYIYDGADTVVELAGEGTDTVRSALSVTLSDNVETLELTGGDSVSGSGNSSNNVITGNAGSNSLYGLAGNDTLSGGGGTDSLYGGTGDDIYLYDGVDATVELSGEGLDTVRSSVSVTLADNIELLELLGTNGVSGTGNVLDNSLNGNSGNNLLSGLDGNDALFGSDGNDTLVGGNGYDGLHGGAGIDILTGGANDDRFGGTRAEMNGDTITDLQIGETITFTDANLSSFNWSLVGSTLNYSGGSLTLGGGVTGRFVASADLNGGVMLTLEAPVPDVRNDFNGDGRSDILWRNITTGQVSNWLGQANGGFVGNDANAFATVPTSWTIVGTGDFNGDGRDDVLWRNSNGQLSDWLGTANGGFTPNDANALTTVPTSWSVVGTGDFNGDGRDDILWRNSNGQLSDWLGQTNGGFVGNDANAFTSVPTNWHVAGTGDFNGDGRDDILWRSDAGQLSDWLGQASGGFVGNDANAFASAPTDWHIVGTGDFNGDGRDDILWRSDAGQLSDWLGQANGGFVGNDANAFTTVPTSWSVVAVGDYNGDGRDDILWRNANGQLSDWLGQANGGFVGNDSNAFTSVPTNWHVQAEAPLL